MPELFEGEYEVSKAIRGTLTWVPQPFRFSIASLVAGVAVLLCCCNATTVSYWRRSQLRPSVTARHRFA